MDWIYYFVLIVILLMALIKQSLGQADAGPLGALGWLDRATGGLTGVFVSRRVR